MPNRYATLVGSNRISEDYTKINTGFDAVQSDIDTHLADTGAHGATSAATASRIMMRDSQGRAKVAAPSAATDIARKDTVDAAIATAAGDATAKADAVQDNLDTHTGNADIHTTAAEKAKLAGIETGAEVNQPAFSTVNDIGATDPEDTFIIVGGVGITISTDPVTKTVTVTATGTAAPGAHASTHITGGADVIPNAVAGGASGLLSGADKTIIDNALLKTGGTMTGQLRVETTGREISAGTWVDLSANSTGYALLAQNCYTSHNNDYKYANTHASMGARGIRFNHVTLAVEYFDTGAIATTADAVFTPTWINITPTTAATANRPLMRDGSGRGKVAAPSVADDIARKDTVDSAAALKVSKAGDMMTGDLSINKTNSSLFLEAPNFKWGARNIGGEFFIQKYDANTWVGDGLRILSNWEVHIGGGPLYVSGNKVWDNGNSAANLSFTGYQRLASGLILQWGSLYLANGTEAFVTFPITFPSYCSVFTPTVEDTSAYATMGAKASNGALVRHSASTARFIVWTAIGY